MEKLGIKRATLDTAGDAFLQGEGSRCRSNSDDSAMAFIQQLIDTPQLSDAERQSLGRARMQLLETCTWEGEKFRAGNGRRLIICKAARGFGGM